MASTWGCFQFIVTILGKKKYYPIAATSILEKMHSYLMSFTNAIFISLSCITLWPSV